MGSFIDGAQQELHNFLSGLIENYQPGRPLSQVASQITAPVNKLLNPFRHQFPAQDLGNGLWNIGGSITMDMDVMDEAYIADEYKVTVPTVGREESYTRSNINGRKPSATHPIGQMIGDTTIKITPPPTELIVQFLIHPPPTNVVFLNNYQIDPNASTELAWTMKAVPYLLYYVMQTFGISVNAPPLIKFAQDNKLIAI